MKRLLVFFILYFLAQAEAQTTTINGTVTDIPDAQVWANGTFKVEFFPNTNFPNLSQYYVNFGGTSTPLSNFQILFNGTMSGTGTFSQAGIPRTDLISPQGSLWKLTFCPMASAPCVTTNLALNGVGPLNITSSIAPAITSPRFTPIYGTYGYNDNEAQAAGASPGSSYYNVITSCQKNYDPVGHVWNCIGAGSAGMNPVNPTFTGVMTGPTITSSINRILSVMSPPYNAVGNCVADDTTAVRAAFSDAISFGYQVYFPAGCYWTDTVTWTGQSFYGAGRTLTTIRGKAGHDVFQAPDGTFSVQYAPLIKGLTISVDASVDASATAAGGNNTYPNRISGTAGGLTAFSNPPAPGPILFGPFYNVSSSSGSINSGSNVLTVTDGAFTQRPPSWVVGAPITVKGAGVSGADLVTTIAGVTSGSVVTLTANASTTVTNGSGSWGNPAKISTPWYFGNCGLAIPQSDGTNGAPGQNGLNMQDMIFNAWNGSGYNNHVCGLFIQSAPNDLHFEKLDFVQLWGGYVEAFPATNAGSLFAWTPDTSSYRDMNFKFDVIPAVFYNGSHRVIDGFTIYSGEQPFAYGLMWFNTGFASVSASRYYDECWSSNSGEHARISGGQMNFFGGELGQCIENNLYTRWDASNSIVNASVRNVQINGSGNIFSAVGVVVDNGQANRAFSINNYSGNNTIPGYVAANQNTPRQTVGNLQGSFLLVGSKPFTSGDDLLIPCDQMSFAWQLYGIGPGCTPDPTGTEITKSYVHMTTAAYSFGWYLYPTTNNTDGGMGVGPYGKFLTVGDRLPQTKLNFSVLARCNAACTQSIGIYDDTAGNASLASGTLSFGTSWTLQTITVDLSTVTLGDKLGIKALLVGGTGVTSQDLAFLGFAIAPAASTSSGLTGWQDVVAVNAIDNTGSTDVSGAILGIINSLSSTSPNTLYFAPGIYRIDTGILIAATSTTKNGIRLVGAGRDSTIFRSACTNGYGIWYDNTTNSGDNFAGMMISDIQFQDSSASNNACNDMLKFTQTSLNVIERIKILNARGNTYSTGTIAISGATVTGTGTTWTASMVPGVLQVNGVMAEVCNFVSATQLTLCDNTWPKGTISAGASYALAYGGRGLTFDPGNSFTQYITVRDYFGSNDLFCIYSMGSNVGSNGNSRITIDGKAGWCGASGLRLANSVGVWLGRHSDTFWVSIPINNVSRCTVLDSAHAITFQGFDCENNSSQAVVTTCNSGVASQSCIFGAEMSADATSTGYGNSFISPYIYLTGTAFLTDNANGANNLTITGLRSASFSNTNSYSFNGTLGCPANSSGVNASIFDWDCVHQQIAATVQ